MSFYLHFLNASGKFSPVQAELLRDITASSLEEAARILGDVSLDVVFFHYKTKNPEHFVASGKSVNASTTFIYVDTEQNSFNERIHQQLKYVVAHEYHHTVRRKSVGYGEILGECLITEGLADHFAGELYSGSPPIWCAALGDDLNIWLNEAKSKFYEKEYNHAEWFMGAGKRIPKWAGYTLGFHIVGEYMREHGLSASELVDIKAEMILGSRYARSC